jgi:hypothetical protein
MELAQPLRPFLLLLRRVLLPSDGQNRQ